MPETNTHTAVITAVEAEAAPIARRLGLRPADRAFADSPAWSGSFAEQSILLTATGMGRDRAAAATEALLAQARPQRVLIVGFAGALDPQLYVCEVVIPDTLIDVPSGRTFAHETEGRSRRLVTVDQVTSSVAEKTMLRRQHQADLVDMESAVVAQACEAADVPWLCLRVVLDVANETLPRWLSRCVDSCGRPRKLATVGQALIHPLDWTTLARTALQAKASGKALADALPPLLAASKEGGG